MATDAILLEVFNNALITIGEEMAATVKRTARSMNARSGDSSTVIADARGEILAQGQGGLFHLGYAKETLPHVLAKWAGRLKPGDIIIGNDPYQGSAHLPDVLMTAPVFWEGEVAAFVIALAHQSDIGGRVPGGQGADSAEIFEEGMIIPNVKVFQEGEPNWAVLDLIRANVRAPDDVVGDLQALAAACRRGVQGVTALLERYGRRTFEDCIDGLKAYSQDVLQAALSQMPDGEYESEDCFEDNGLDGGGVTLKVRVTKRGGSLTFDFTGTDPQVRSAINCPWGNTWSGVYLVCRYLLAPDAPANAGLFRTIDVIAPEGCIVRPRFPAAVGARGMLLWRICDVVAAAMGKGMPWLTMAEGEGGSSSLTYLADEAGSMSMMVDWYSGSWGARPTSDGIDGARALLAGSGGCDTSTEIAENEYPILIRSHAYEPDTGGAGKYRGGLSVVRSFQFLRDGRALLRTCRSNSLPHGLAGGGDGTPFRAALSSGNDQRLLDRRMILDFRVSAGEVLTHVLPGCGGYGDRLERDAEAVLEDVIDGRLSLAYAERVYGVVIDPATRAIDHARTAELRAKEHP